MNCFAAVIKLKIVVDARRICKEFLGQGDIGFWLHASLQIAYSTAGYVSLGIVVYAVMGAED